MSVKFHALEVGSGDAFLLENNEWRCLFDAGGNKSLIKRLLRNKNIDTINLAICSHNDKDHANGFIGLLDTKSRITVNEIWLPCLWGNILQFIEENGIPDDEYDYDFEQLQKWVRKQEITPSTLQEQNPETVNAEVLNNKLALFAKMLESIQSDDEYNRFPSRRYGWQLEESTPRNYDWLCENIMKRVINNLPEKKQDDYLYYKKGFIKTIRILITPNKKLNDVEIELKRIITIAGLAYKKKCLIRWFEPTNYCTKNAISHGFVALNSREIVRVGKLTSFSTMLYALTLTMENKFSLVFEYCTDNNIPIVRFSADSDCTCQSVCPYGENIIVTAPHHGSEANAIVYIVIKGNDIIWVRSDSITKQRPCIEFKRQAQRYCLACGFKKFKKEINFEYDSINKKWVYKVGNLCTC